MKNNNLPEAVDRTTLDNGMRILTERVDSVKSVSVGIWVRTGSRHESEEHAGITHFLEHMLFKGTESRSSYDIALSMESVGGYLNALTSSEYTCYYARCLSSQIDKALDVLTDMVLHPIFPEDEIEKEKKVVIEEMKMYRDNPEDYLFESFSNQLFRGHPLGRPVIGFEETVGSFSRDDLYNYMDARYYPQNLLIAVAGDVEHKNVVDLVKERFDQMDRTNKSDEDVVLIDHKADRQQLTKAIEQTHYVLGRRALPADHDDKYKLLLANTVLGGGMSSRLHQHIREQYGYCYAIHAFSQTYSDTGLYGVYAGTDREYVDHLRDLIIKEFKQLREEPVSEKELAEAKSQLKGKLLLALESMSNRMSRLAKSEFYFNRYVTLDELVEEIDGVKAEDIQQFADDFYKEDKYSEALLLPEE